MTIELLKQRLAIIESSTANTERAILCRELLKDAINFIYEQAKQEKPKSATLLELIDNPVVARYINDIDVISSLHYVRILGMHAKHGSKIRKKEVCLAQENIKNLIEFLIAKNSGDENKYSKPQYMSEAITRRQYVDLYLREAGWEIIDKDNTVLPSMAGTEIEVHGMPNESGIGFCDYVLYGRDAKPIAVIEAKKTSKDPETGRHQVDLYAECIKKKYGYKPVMYYTNGYEIKIIDGMYPDRTVAGFHSLSDLEWLMERRQHQTITDLSINDNITNRPYQKIAITNMCERFNSKRRKGLIVMATGTGKTRVAVSLADVLCRNRLVKNVLFLADRTTLVSQAKNKNFSKLLPDMSACELSGTGKDKDYNARLMFSTYQTMINYINDEDKRFSAGFSIGRFDLIILDEAHRSIFNKYAAIFNYFDSLLVGLTATPKNDVDANTYRIFGCETGIPNFDYPLKDAIRDGYLVGYKVINKSSDIMTGGIRYDDLTEDEKEQLDEYISAFEDPPTPDFTIPKNEIFKHLFNKDTCKKVIQDLMTQGISVNGGETIGKSIIFAYNHHHAQMIVDCFYELYPEYHANTCQLVDYSVSYADTLKDQFEEDDEFRIAVSVDMLDTGVDIPAVLNLVFFKKVRSKIKFMQMIGRGTRLCKNVYGNGKDKDGFLIFDYCGNFEYFDMHPQIAEGAKSAPTISQRIFNLKLDMLYELQQYNYQKDDWLHSYYKTLKEGLQNAVQEIKSRSKQIQVRSEMQYVDKFCDSETWTALSPVTVKEAQNHITCLICGTPGEDYLELAFDARMYYIENSFLKYGTVDAAQKHIKNIRQCAQYLLDKKASVPQVLAKAEALKQIVSELFWVSASVKQIEDMRLNLRGLMHFLENNGKNNFDIDIVDVINESDYKPSETLIDIRTYREKVIDYLAENSNNSVIRKIYNLEPITNVDLEELEHILWHDLGTKQDYRKTTNMHNVAAFVRSLIGLSQEAVNNKFSAYLSGSLLNSRQQEFIHTIINYVRQNGDIELKDIVNTEPFNYFNVNEMFGSKVEAVKKVVNTLHDSVQVA